MALRRVTCVVTLLSLTCGCFAALPSFLQMRMDFNPIAHAWAVGDGFKFDILHLEREQSGSIKVPKKVLLWVINWLIPDMLKTELVKLVPPEIGAMLLTTRQTAAINVAV